MRAIKRKAIALNDTIELSFHSLRSKDDREYKGAPIALRANSV
ncbi:MAG: hypothetical protein Q7L19_01950 [Pseudohongiella sp.]|nr:hypothetical protein [Pseudohongiella sp.]